MLGTLAILGYKLRRAMTAGEAAAVEDEVETGPEMPADRAAKYYAASVTSLKLRFRLALFLSVILCWISFGLPTAGALGADVPEDEFEAMRLLQEKTGVPAPASLAGLREKPVRFTQVVEKDGIRAAALAL